MSLDPANGAIPTTGPTGGGPTEIFPGRPLPSFGEGGDMGGVLSGVFVGTFAIATLFVLARMYCKILRYRSLTIDDYILFGAWTCFGANNSMGLRLVALGLGKHVYEVAPEVLPKFLLPANVSITLGVVALAWSKTSFAVTLICVLSGWERRILYLAIITLNATHAISAMLPWISCRPLQKNWNPLTPGTCENPPPDVVVTYNIVVNSYAGALDLIFVGLAWKTIMSLHMKMREKIGVALAMSMGTFAAVCTFIKCTHLRDLLSPDFTYNSGPVAIWTSAEMAAVIIAACVPSLRILVRTARSKLRQRRNTTARSRTRTTVNKNSTTLLGGWYGTATKVSRHSWSPQGETYLMKSAAIRKGDGDPESLLIYVDRGTTMEWNPRVGTIHELENGDVVAELKPAHV